MLKVAAVHGIAAVLADNLAFKIEDIITHAKNACHK